MIAIVRPSSIDSRAFDNRDAVAGIECVERGNGGERSHASGQRQGQELHECGEGFTVGKDTVAEWTLPCGALLSAATSRRQPPYGNLS